MENQDNLSPQNWMEKLGIVKQLGEIQLEQVKQNSKIDEILRMAGNHHRTLYGNDGEPGLDKIVDRLNQTEKERSKHFWVLYPEVALALAKNFIDFIKSK